MTRHNWEIIALGVLFFGYLLINGCHQRMVGEQILTLEKKVSELTGKLSVYEKGVK